MQLSDIYRGITESEVSARDTVLFWKDNWNTEIFQDKYPRAFSFAKEPDVSVRKLLSFERLGEVFHLPLSLEARTEVAGLQSDTMETTLTEDKDV